MLKSKTVFILGAGASSEVKLPAGGQLKNIIAQKLDLPFDKWSERVGSGDRTILAALQQYNNDEISQYLKACLQISSAVSLSDSIDDFIDMHQHDSRIQVCGKVAITRAILEAEEHSTLSIAEGNVNNTIKFERIQDTWYMRFYNLLTKGINKSQLNNVFDNITVISFNYDRCLQHFLVHAFAQNCLISVDEAKKLVRKLVVLHPYGTVGSYFPASHGAATFGAKRLPPVEDIIRNIRTYTEQIEDKSELNEIQRVVHEASTLVFLGCAFHPNNMNLLKGDFKFQEKRFFATRKGIYEKDLMVVCSQLFGLCGGESTFNQAPNNMFFAETCKDLFSEYQRSLHYN